MKNRIRGERQKVKIFLVYFCLLVFLLSCQSATMPKGLEVKVARVVSGQTLEVTSSESKVMSVRLIGIDAPDLQQQPWGQAAKQRLAAMIGTKPVLLEFDVQKQDSFGRRLAYVWQDGVLLNESLVAEGYVLSGRSPNNKYDQRLDRAQEWARLMGRLIWNPEKPMRLTPSEFRRQYR
ncbi:MAG: thermonuclease family protein [Gloeocapsa sp. UFS-A4-WI-NPMV-4B04]|jgi:micrococcal nuclease|nr:thermonuclease family protein [Gloeocapsa sp. UFS-A4-WI-NPMV-4B04]